MQSRQIEADGMVWPLDTYLDARGYRRVDPFDVPAIDGDVRLLTVTQDCALVPPRFASDIDWTRTLAFRPLDGAPPCRCCGKLCARADGDDICNDCDDDHDWWFQ